MRKKAGATLGRHRRRRAAGVVARHVYQEAGALVGGGEGHQTSPQEVMLAVFSMLFRAEFRHRWRSWLYLAVLVALVSGLVLAGMAAGRRTATAFPRYLAAYGADVEAFSFKPIPTISSLPEVEKSMSALIPANGPPACSGCR